MSDNPLSGVTDTKQKEAKKKIWSAVMFLMEKFDMD